MVKEQVCLCGTYDIGLEKGMEKRNDSKQETEL